LGRGEWKGGKLLFQKGNDLLGTSPRPTCPPYVFIRRAEALSTGAEEWPMLEDGNQF
jgi:hypothetical protein